MTIAPPDPSLPESIARQLRRGILRGELAPGALIKERDNAAELGVSRTPMREAIRILAKEGLVVLRPSRSPIVAAPTLEEVANAIDVLRVLEMLSVVNACARASTTELAEIRALERELAARFEIMEDIDRFELDMAFHRAIVRAAQNPMLAETHTAYLARLWRALFLSANRKRSRDRVLRQHGGIIDALEARDEAAARHYLGEHLEHLLINVRDFFASQGRLEDSA